MLYVDDKLSRHPKIMKAGELLGGGDGPARALALFLDGLSYTREHLTDGHVPTAIVATSPLVTKPLAVAASLARVRLWHRTKTGYRFHDYHDWNKSATLVKKQRRKWREKKRRQRLGNNGRFTGESPGDMARDEYRDSRARDPRTTYHVPSTKPRTRGTGTCTGSVLTARFARGIHTFAKEKKTPTHRVLCAMLRAELADDPSISNALEGVKLRLVRQGFAYPENDRLDRALQSVERVQRKESA